MLTLGDQINEFLWPYLVTLSLPGRHDISGDEEGDPGHDDEYGRGEIHVEEIGRHAAGEMDLQAVDRIVACKQKVSRKSFQNRGTIPCFRIRR